MKKFIFILLILSLFIFTGCNEKRKETIEEKLVFGIVTNKNYYWSSTKVQYYDVTIKYDNIEKTFDNENLFNIVNIDDNIQVIYRKYRIISDKDSSIYHTIYLL